MSPLSMQSTFPHIPTLWVTPPDSQEPQQLKILELLDLPITIIALIYEKLDAKDKKALANTCRLAREIFYNPSALRHLITKDLKTHLSTRVSIIEQALKLQTHGGTLKLLVRLRINPWDQEDMTGCLKITSDGQKAIFGTKSGIILIWDLSQKTCICRLKGHTQEVTCLQITPDGKKAVSGSNELRIWDLMTMQCLQVLKNPAGDSSNNAVSSLQITPDGTKAVAGLSNGNVQIWDLTTGSCLLNCNIHTFPIDLLSVTPDGTKAIFASTSQAILQIWDLTTRKWLSSLTGHQMVVTSLQITPDGTRAVSVSNDIRIWDVMTGKCLQILKIDHSQGNSWINCAQITPDGTKAIFGSENGTLQIWDLNTGKCLYFFKQHHPGELEHLQLTPDGKKVLSSSYLKIINRLTGDVSFQSTLQFTNLNGQSLSTVPAIQGRITNITIHPDGLSAFICYEGEGIDIQEWALTILDSSQNESNLFEPPQIVRCKESG